MLFRIKHTGWEVRAGEGWGGGGGVGTQAVTYMNLMVLS